MSNLSIDEQCEAEGCETYYDLFLLRWGDLAEVIRENLSEQSALAAMCKSATPSRVIAAVDYFSSVIVSAASAGVSEEVAVARVLKNFGAPPAFYEGENLARVVASITDLRKILEACRKE